MTATDAATAASSDAPMSTGRPGNTTGRVVMSSCSFAKVTNEPENEIAPTSSGEHDREAHPRVSVCASSSSATSAAAPPPTPLKRATSCGICVICTRRATGAAMAEPTAIAREDPRDVVELDREEHGDDRDERAGRADAGCRGARSSAS